MLTKKQLAEAIILQKTGGNPATTSPIDERDVFAMADMVMADLIVQDIRQQIKGNDSNEIDSTWVKTFTGVPVQYDRTTEQCYIDLPATRVNIQGDQDIRYVGYRAGGQKWPQEGFDQQQAWTMLEAGAGMPNVYPYYPVENRLYFRTMTRRHVGEKIMVRMVCGIDGYGINDPLPIPSAMGTILLERLGNMFNVQISTKSKNNNDSNPNVRV